MNYRILLNKQKLHSHIEHVFLSSKAQIETITNKLQAALGYLNPKWISNMFFGLGAFAIDIVDGVFESFVGITLTEFFEVAAGEFLITL